MKRLLSDKRFITIAGTILIVAIWIGIFYAISQCINGNLDISIKIN
jgi:hypothetical protein